MNVLHLEHFLNCNLLTHSGEKAILELLKAVDTAIPTPVRELDKPFLIPIENVYTIPGKYTIEKYFAFYFVYLVSFIIYLQEEEQLQQADWNEELLRKELSVKFWDTALI